LCDLLAIHITFVSTVSCVQIIADTEPDGGFFVKMLPLFYVLVIVIGSMGLLIATIGFFSKFNKKE